MAKSKLSIGRFDSGIVEGPNPRDIADEASVDMEGLDPVTIGGLRPLGSYISSTYPIFNKVMTGGLTNWRELSATNDATGFNSGDNKGFGYGLFQFSSDFPNLPLGNARKLNTTTGLSSLPLIDDANFNVDYNASAVTNTEDTLYTLLVTQDSEGSDAGTWTAETANLVEGGVVLFVHWYSLYDNGTTHNEWYQLGFSGRDSDGISNPSNIWTDNVVQFGLQYNKEYSGIYNLGESGFNYLPKFYVVNGSPRIYDGFAQGPSYYLKYINRGGKLNGLEPEDIADAHKVNQWSFEVNKLYAPSLKHVQSRTTPGAGARNGKIVFNGWKVTDIGGYTAPISAISADKVPLASGSARPNDALLSTSGNDFDFMATNFQEGDEIIISGFTDSSGHNNVSARINDDYDFGITPTKLYLDEGSLAADEAATGKTINIRKAGSMGMQQFFQVDDGTAGFVNNTRSSYYINYQFIPSDSIGGWEVDRGAVTFHASYVFDGNQEGPLSSIPGQYYPGAGAGPEVNSSLQMHFCFPTGSDVAQDAIPGSFSNWMPGPRQSGIKVYYSYGNPSNPDGDEVSDPGVYLLFEFDHEKGIRISGDDSWRTVNTNGNIFHTFNEPPELEDFLTENGYRPGQRTEARFGTALFAKNRVWAGNVTIDSRNYPDRILKSPVGIPDVFPEENFLDITGADGDEIVHLENKGDELIVFKKRSMYVIDIATMDEEKLKDTYPGMGITNYNHACSSPHGICFANPGGVFIYNGEEVENLFIEEGVDKVSNETWKFETNWDSDVWNDGKLDMEYSLENDKLIVLMNTVPGQDQAGDIYCYHFKNKSWTKGRGSMPQSFSNDKYHCTNLIKDYQNRILLAGIDHADTGVGNLIPTTNNSQETDTYTLYNMKFFQWDEALTSDTSLIRKNGLKWISRDLDFGGIGSKKSITKVYVTYRVAGIAPSHIKVKYSVDGDVATTYDFSNVSTFDDKSGEEIGYNKTTGLKGTNGIFRTVELIPEDRVQCKKVNSFQIHLTNESGPTPKAQLNFDDFTIIYKEHTTK